MTAVKNGMTTGSDRMTTFREVKMQFNSYEEAVEWCNEHKELRADVEFENDEVCVSYSCTNINDEQQENIQEHKDNKKYAICARCDTGFMYVKKGNKITFNQLEAELFEYDTATKKAGYMSMNGNYAWLVQRLK